jgi:hypothetical protein
MTACKRPECGANSSSFITCRESEKQDIENHQRPPGDVDEFRRDWAEREVDAR